MNTRQFNKVAMYRATRALLENAPETETIVAFSAAFAGFKQKLVALETLVATQTVPLAPTIALRESVLDEMIAAVLEVAGIASDYALEHNLRDLALHMGVQAADFKRLRLDDRVRRAQSIVDILRPLLPQLAERGLTAAALDAVQAKITAGDNVSPAARQLVLQKSAATFELAHACVAMDQILTGRLDALLRPLQRTDPQFYKKYLDARTVVDRPGSRSAKAEEVVPLPVPAPPTPELKAA